MYFTHRLPRPKDLEACFSMLREKYAYDAKAKKDLLAIWKLLIEEEATGSIVIEARDLPANRRQVGFGLSYFLTNEFFHRLKTKLPPFGALRIAEKWRRGIQPFLLKKEIDKANRGEGLNLFVPHYGWDTQRLSPEDIFKVRSLMQECFLIAHGGYRVKELMHEAHGPELLGLMTNAGEILRRDYKEFAGTSYLKGISKNDHPYLTGCTPAEAWKQPGSYMAIFWSKITPSRFRFNSGEQKVLDRALLGETDEQMAPLLRVSHWTVKKRWQSIYSKVAAVDSGLLTEDSNSSGPETGRVKQKRRHLLEYLRHHPEELRVSSQAHRKKN